MSKYKTTVYVCHIMFEYLTMMVMMVMIQGTPLWSIPLWPLLCVRSCSKFFICMNSFNLYDNPIRQVLLFLFYR